MMKPISDKERFLPPIWTVPLYEEWDKYQYFIIYGGRGSSKTESVVQFLVHKMATTRVRIISAGETMASQDQSSRSIIIDWIDKLGYGSFFTTNRTMIICDRTGSTIRFTGVNPTHAANREAVKGQCSTFSGLKKLNECLKILGN